MTDEFHLDNARRIAHLLDSRFDVLGVKIGIDPLLDLIPGLGDVIATVMALYIIYVAFKFKLPAAKITRMLINVFLDTLLDALPVIGNIGTIFFRSNRMNIHILEDYLSSHAGIPEGPKLLG